MLRSLIQGKTLRLGLLTLSCAILGLASFGLTALATTPPPTPTLVGQGLEISPPIIELKTDPGQTIQTQVKLRNVTNNNLQASTQFDDFLAQGETGQPRILLNPGEKSPYSLKDWLQSVPSVVIPPKVQKTIPLTITVPKDASPGGHYGLIRFTAAAQGANSGVSLSASLGTLLLVDVSGKVTEQITVKDFYTSQHSHQKGFFEYGPVNFTLRLQNEGNIHERPTGDIAVKNMFGSKTGILKINDPPHNVLPGSIRRFDEGLNKHWMFGRYSATLSLLYGSQNTKLQKTISFWVIPYKLLIIVLLIILIVGILIWWSLKSYKKRIIEQHRRS